MLRGWQVLWQVLPGYSLYWGAPIAGELVLEAGDAAVDAAVSTK